MINVDELIKQSMKSKDRASLKAYKNLKAEIQKFKTAENAKPYNENEETLIIRGMCKSLEKAIKEFEEAGRNDLADEYKEELGILNSLLPAPVSEDEMLTEIKEWMDINDCLTIPQKSMGMVIKYVKMKLPTVDGKALSTLVAKLIKDGVK